MNVMENIRKMMGWCPQKKIVYRTEDEFISDYAYCSKTPADDNTIHKGMDVPLQMFDWRIWAIILGFTGLIVFSIAWVGYIRVYSPFLLCPDCSSYNIISYKIIY